MSLLFIKEKKETNKLNLLFNKIDYKIINNNRLLVVPINKNGKLTNRKIKKIITKIQSNNAKKVVLSKYLNNIIHLKQELESNNIYVIDGTKVFKMLLTKIIVYICNKSKIEIKKLKISFLINNLNEINKQIILEQVKMVKSLNLVTKNRKIFKNIEDYLYNEMGIILKFSKNIDKASYIIINFDYSEEELKECNLPNQSIIININGNIKINSKKFNGINVNDCNIIMPSKYKIKDFDDKLIYESIIIDKDYRFTIKKIQDDRIEIKNLIGEKGVIDEAEF